MMKIRHYRNHEQLMPLFDGEYNPPQDPDSSEFDDERAEVFDSFLHSAETFFGANAINSEDGAVEISPPFFSTSRKIGAILNDSRWQNYATICWIVSFPWRGTEEK